MKTNMGNCSMEMLTISQQNLLKQIMNLLKGNKAMCELLEVLPQREIPSMVSNYVDKNFLKGTKYAILRE